MEIIPQILLVLLLVFLNGFFVASEFALVGVRRTRIKELVKRGRRRAKLVDKALEDLDSFISATQLGITLASIGLGWIGEPALARFLVPVFGTVLNPEAVFITSHAVAGITAFTIITFLHIVLGELAPKTVALQRSEPTAMLIIAPLLLFTKIFWPFIWILNGAGSLVLKIFGLHAPTGHQLVHSEEEIKMILAQSALGGAIEPQEAEMVYKVFQFGDTPIRKVMIPLKKVIALDANSTMSEVLKKVKRTTHSRFPVFNKSIDQIIGLIHIKDIYKSRQTFNGTKRIRNTQLVRNVLTVSELRLADDVFLEMRKKKMQLAVVTDNFGRTSGIVTQEDLVEAITGKIRFSSKQKKSIF